MLGTIAGMVAGTSELHYKLIQLCKLQNMCTCNQAFVYPVIAGWLSMYVVCIGMLFVVYVYKK